MEDGNLQQESFELFLFGLVVTGILLDELLVAEGEPVVPNAGGTKCLLHLLVGVTVTGSVGEAMAGSAADAGKEFNLVAGDLDGVEFGALALLVGVHGVIGGVIMHAELEEEGFGQGPLGRID